MPFIFCLKKNPKSAWSVNANDLDNPGITSYQSPEIRSFSNQMMRLWLYSFKSEVPENEAVFSDDSAFFVEGVAVHPEKGITDSKTVFKALQSEVDLQGDYISFGIDKNGTGEVFTTLITFNRLFMFEDADCYVFASEIRLIYESVEAFRSETILESLNPEFVWESIENEWGERKFPHTTMFHQIERVPSTTKLTFETNSLDKKDRQFQMFSTDLEEIYLRNKDDFYDYVFEKLVNAIELELKDISKGVIDVLLSGGLDSRLNACLLFPLYSKYGVDIHATIYGPDDHPDVVIAKKLSETLQIEYQQQTSDGKLYFPKSLDDYRNCINVSQGDWSSNNWRTSRTFVSRIVLSGQDNFKRHNWSKIFSHNRWYAARMAYTKTFPILSHPIINDAALIYGKHHFHAGMFEFAYELIRRFAPKVLDIPLVGMSLPQHPVDAYSTVRASKIMPSHLQSGYLNESYLEKFLFKMNTTLERKLDFDQIVNDERKKRIAMDFASVMDLESFLQIP